MLDCIWNTRVRKHNLRGSENKMNMIVREPVCISVWHYAPVRKKGMNGVVHDVKSISGWHVHY